MGRNYTGDARLESVALRDHQGRVGTELADEHRERAARDVRVVELEVYVVDAVLARQEPTRQPKYTAHDQNKWSGNLDEASQGVKKVAHTRLPRRVPELIPVLGSQPAGDESETRR